MRALTNKELENIVLYGDENTTEGYRLGARLNEIFNNDQDFARACHDPSFMPITICIGKDEFHFSWISAVVDRLDDLAESVSLDV